MRNMAQTYGLLPNEEAIMDAFDEGLSFDEIAERVGRSKEHVRKTVNNFREGKRDRWHCGVRPATDRLLAAIARAHPEMVA